MKFDFLADPALAARFAVVNGETGEPIEDVAWADDEAGVYATIRKRPKTFRDKPNADLRVRAAHGGGFVLQHHTGAIEFVDRTVNPLKADLLALLDDPEVAAKIRTTKEFDRLVIIVAGLLDAVKWHLRGAAGTDQRSLDQAMGSFRMYFLGQQPPADQDAPEPGP